MTLPLDLTWDAPAGCPDEVAIVARVERILVAPAPPGVTVIARGKVRTKDNRRFELVLTLRTGDVEETRTVEAPSCAAIADASAVVIALAMDPSHAHVAPEPEVTPVPPPPPPPPPPSPPPPPPPSRQPAPEKKAIVAIDVGATFEPTTLPKIGGGLEIGALFRWKRFRVGVRSAFWLRENAVFDDASGAGASFGMFQIGASAAYLFPVYRTIAIGPALGVDADIVRVRGFGIRNPHTSWASWPMVAVGVRGEMQLHHYLGVYARADLVAPIDAPPFVLGTASASGAVPLFDVPALGPRFSAGIEVLLP